MSEFDGIYSDTRATAYKLQNSETPRSESNFLRDPAPHALRLNSRLCSIASRLKTRRPLVGGLLREREMNQEVGCGGVSVRRDVSPLLWR